MIKELKTIECVAELSLFPRPFKKKKRKERKKEINTKTELLEAEKKIVREVARGDKHHLSKSAADCKAQISPSCERNERLTDFPPATSFVFVTHRKIHLAGTSTRRVHKNHLAAFDQNKTFQMNTVHVAPKSGCPGK